MSLCNLAALLCVTILRHLCAVDILPSKSAHGEEKLYFYISRIS